MPRRLGPSMAAGAGGAAASMEVQRTTRCCRDAGSSDPLIAEQPDFLAPLAREEVDPVDESNPVAARAHEQRVRARAVAEEADAAQQVAVRDARRGDDDLPGREVL